jgi:hypothetical protein
MKSPPKLRESYASILTWVKPLFLIVRSRLIGKKPRVAEAVTKLGFE